MSGRIRVLCLDGGGIRGVFAAAFLADLEERSGKRVVDHFDLITGTSTGGILALGLALGMSASDILSFYEREGPLIFPTGHRARLQRHITKWFAAKHDARVLAEKLKTALTENATLGDARTRVVIPAFDVDRGRPVCFKTPHHESLNTDFKRKAWEVAMATASAPTYFAPFHSSWGTRYIDGGVWANRPIMVGVVEAVRYLGAPVDSVEILAIGTTCGAFRLNRLWANGLLPWLRNGSLVDVLMQSGEWSASFQSRLLLPNRVVEINHQGATHLPMDDARLIPELVGLGRQIAKERAAEVATQFLDVPRSPYSPWYDVSVNTPVTIGPFAVSTPDARIHQSTI